VIEHVIAQDFYSTVFFLLFFNSAYGKTDQPANRRFSVRIG